MDRDATYLSIINRYLVMDGARTVFTTRASEEGLSVVRMARPEVDCIICAEDLVPVTGIEMLKDLRSGKHGDTSSIRDFLLRCCAGAMRKTPGSRLFCTRSKLWIETVERGRRKLALSSAAKAHDVSDDVGPILCRKYEVRHL